MSVTFAPVPTALLRRSLMGHSAMRLFRQKVTPSPTRRLVHKPADLAAQARPGATPASDFAPPVSKWAPHTTVPVQMESLTRHRAVHASLADSTTSVVPKAEHSDR